MKKIIIVYIVLINVFTLSFAHSGRTDSNGGHWNRSTGEYHYHHGYSEHQHINGFCPYETELSDILPSICPSCKATTNSENGLYCFECAYRLIPENINLISVVDGPANKTRSQYYKELQSLETLVDSKTVIINNLYNSIDEKDTEIERLKDDKKSLHFVYWFVIICMGIAIWNLSRENKK